MQKIIDGLLLGDGYLSFRCRSTPDKARPRFGYNCKYLEFTQWVVDTLLPFGFTFGPIITKPNGYHTGFSYQADSRVFESLRVFWNRWYPNGKKVLPTDIILTPMTVNLWYCGDGGFNSYRGYLSGISIAAHSFDFHSRQRLVDQLIKIGFKSKTSENDGRIHIRKSSTVSFLSWMRSYPSPCYFYKWDHLRFTSKTPKYAKRISKSF